MFRRNARQSYSPQGPQAAGKTGARAALEGARTLLHGAIALVFGILLLAGANGVQTSTHMFAAAPQSASGQVRHDVTPVQPVEAEAYQPSNNDDAHSSAVIVATASQRTYTAAHMRWQPSGFRVGMLPGISRGGAPPALLIA